MEKTEVEVKPEKTAKPRNAINMTEGHVLKKMLLFTLPLMGSSILQLLFNAADIIVVALPVRTHWLRWAQPHRL